MAQLLDSKQPATITKLLSLNLLQSHNLLCVSVQILYQTTLVASLVDYYACFVIASRDPIDDTCIRLQHLVP